MIKNRKKLENRRFNKNHFGNPGVNLLKGCIRFLKTLKNKVGKSLRDFIDSIIRLINRLINSLHRRRAQNPVPQPVQQPVQQPVTEPVFRRRRRSSSGASSGTLKINSAILSNMINNLEIIVSFWRQKCETVVELARFLTYSRFLASFNYKVSRGGDINVTKYEFETIDTLFKMLIQSFSKCKSPSIEPVKASLDTLYGNFIRLNIWST